MSHFYIYTFYLLAALIINLAMPQYLWSQEQPLWQQVPLIINPNGLPCVPQLPDPHDPLVDADEQQLGTTTYRIPKMYLGGGTGKTYLAISVQWPEKLPFYQECFLYFHNKNSHLQYQHLVTIFLDSSSPPVSRTVEEWFHSDHFKLPPVPDHTLNLLAYQSTITPSRTYYIPKDNKIRNLVNSSVPVLYLQSQKLTIQGRQIPERYQITNVVYKNIKIDIQFHQPLLTQWQAIYVYAIDLVKRFDTEEHKL